MVCCQANSIAPRIAYATCKIALLVALFVDWSIMHLMSQFLKVHLYGLMRSGYSLEGVLVSEVPPTKWVDKSPPGHPIRTSFHYLGNFKQYQFISVYFMLFPMNRLGKWNDFTSLSRIFFKHFFFFLYVTWTEMFVTWTEKFWYTINDVILKRGKELVKTMLVTLSGSLFPKSL